MNYKKNAGRNIARLLVATGSTTLVMSTSALAGFCLDTPVSGETYKLVNEGTGLNLEVVSKSEDNDARVIQFFGRSGLDSQKFKVTDIGNNQWRFEAVHSGKALTADSIIFQSDSVDADNQAWTLAKTANGAFKIQSVSSKKVMAADSHFQSDFVSEADNNDNDKAHQSWYFNPADIECTTVVPRLDGGASDGKVELTWEKPAGNIEQIEVYYDTDSKPRGRIRLAGLPTNARSYSATGLTNETTYWFWVKFKADGVWHNSNAFQATPDARYAMLSQLQNPIKTELETYKDEIITGTLAGDKVLADNMITWQLPSGGFYKHKINVYEAPWDGVSERSNWFGETTNEDGTTSKVELGTIDNDATVRELMFLADVYQRSGETKYRDAARNAFQFLIDMQYDKGGFPQVYPKRVGTEYSNYVTFNDNAMVRVLYLLDRINEANWPFQGDLFTHDQRSAAELASKKGIKYIRRSQIFVNGERTVWSAQHDPDDYTPLGARSYELPGRNGKASALIGAYLMSNPQTEDIKEAVEGALAFYRNPETQAADKKYIKRAKNSTDDTYNPIQTAEGKTMWYRFYELDSDVAFFSGRLPTDDPAGNGKQYDIMDVEPERRYGYEWGGSYGSKLLKYADAVGYSE